ncbi:hypothetical protein [Moorena sp. SIO4G3]|uniref:hypothetical protein n=1 Tax=Moorena sp. SIO4G3 TaxID=2607821 RepID=UPI00142A27EC|nr:hypothetical protein [Moorena sp. SIO4G3]NEO82456.1 hypothetical protein [Moorena sp. SIO4G3]
MSGTANRGLTVEKLATPVALWSRLLFGFISFFGKSLDMRGGMNRSGVGMLPAGNIDNWQDAGSTKIFYQDSGSTHWVKQQ